jgi:protein-S-isoprenylcysteine O-methyltransferase Ste14
MGHALGWPLILAGLGGALWAVSAAGSLDLQRPDQLVVVGPYARSRNPMYVAWTALYLGVSLVLNTAWPPVLLPLVLVWTHVQIRREERDLAGRFGADYREYSLRTRRYL